MRRNFRGGYVEEYRLLEPRSLRYRAEDLSRLVDFLPELRFFSGHCISADLPYDRPDVEVIGLATVREPVERILSWYAFNRNTHHYALVEKKQSLEAYLDHALGGYDFAADPWRWCQVPDLVDLPGARGLERIGDLVARGRLHLFPMNRFDEMLCFLERTWPEDFGDLAYATRENTSLYDQPQTPAIRDSTARLAELAPLREDRLLLDVADRELTRKIAELPEGVVGFSRRLEEFRNRCTRAQSAEKWLRRPLRRARGLLPGRD
jgi:hypothetical protein